MQGDMWTSNYTVYIVNAHTVLSLNTLSIIYIYITDKSCNNLNSEIMCHASLLHLIHLNTRLSSN